MALAPAQWRSACTFITEARLTGSGPITQAMWCTICLFCTNDSQLLQRFVDALPLLW